MFPKMDNICLNGHQTVHRPDQGGRLMDESATARLKLCWTANLMKGKPLKLNQIF